MRRAALVISLVSGLLLLSTCQRPVSNLSSSTPTPIILAPPPTPDAWERLAQRPLIDRQLPPGTACPVSWGKQVSPDFGPALGDGPIYLVGFGQRGVISFESARLDAGGTYLKVILIAPPDYQGPLLVRGQQVDGPNLMSFGESAHPASQLRLSEQTAIPEPSGWLDLWDGYLRVPAPGCYGVQIDTLMIYSQITYVQVAPAQ